MNRLTDDQVMRMLREDTPFNRVRAQISFSIARAEQRAAQERSISPIELRRREFEDAEKIIKAYLGNR
jgi:hypothetical protein